jgi:hypothetical protein
VNYLLGMAQLGRKFALLLDVDKVLSTDELLNLDQVSANAGATGGEAVGSGAEQSAASDGAAAFNEAEIPDAV